MLSFVLRINISPKAPGVGVLRKHDHIAGCQV